MGRWKFYAKFAKGVGRGVWGVPTVEPACPPCVRGVGASRQWCERMLLGRGYMAMGLG